MNEEYAKNKEGKRMADYGIIDADEQNKLLHDMRNALIQKSGLREDQVAIVYGYSDVDGKLRDDPPIGERLQVTLDNGLVFYSKFDFIEGGFETADQHLAEYTGMKKTYTDRNTMLNDVTKIANQLSGLQTETLGQNIITEIRNLKMRMDDERKNSLIDAMNGNEEFHKRFDNFRVPVGFDQKIVKYFQKWHSEEACLDVLAGDPEIAEKYNAWKKDVNQKYEDILRMPGDTPEKKVSKIRECGYLMQDLHTPTPYMSREDELENLEDSVFEDQDYTAYQKYAVDQVVKMHNVIGCQVLEEECVNQSVINTDDIHKITNPLINSLLHDVSEKTMPYTHDEVQKNFDKFRIQGLEAIHYLTENYNDNPALHDCDYFDLVQLTFRSENDPENRFQQMRIPAPLIHNFPEAMAGAVKYAQSEEEFMRAHLCTSYDFQNYFVQNYGDNTFEISPAYRSLGQCTSRDQIHALWSKQVGNYSYSENKGVERAEIEESEITIEDPEAEALSMDRADRKQSNLNLHTEQQIIDDGNTKQQASPEQERQTEEAIQNRRRIGSFAYVDLPHSETSMVTDRLNGKYKELLITCAEGKSEFYGNGSIIKSLDHRFPGGEITMKDGRAVSWKSMNAPVDKVKNYVMARERAKEQER